MTLNAKSVLKDKFWIVERDGEKIGTVQAMPDGVVYVDGGNRTRYPSIRVLSHAAGIHFERPTRRVHVVPTGVVYGFPVDVPRPHNTLYNVVRRVPVFTKSEKSKSMFCAGYYLIQSDSGWEPEFCPKLITINRYPYLGPFYTLEEQQAALERASGQS